MDERHAAVPLVKIGRQNQVPHGWRMRANGACLSKSLVSNGVTPYFCIKNTPPTAYMQLSFITVRQTMTIIPLIVLENQSSTQGTFRLDPTKLVRRPLSSILTTDNIQQLNFFFFFNNSSGSFLYCKCRNNRFSNN